METIRPVALLAGLALVLAACGGGEEDWPEVPPSENQGAGRVRIESPTEEPTYATSLDTQTITGSAFISPSHYRCCSGSATDTGVTVVWSTAAGDAGFAQQHVRYCALPFTVPYVCDHTWKATIRIRAGSNVITVIASDASGNIGRDTITIIRPPDQAPPTVVSTSPANAAANAPVSAAIRARFDERLTATSINADTFSLVDSRGDPVSGSVEYSDPDDRTASFVAASPLAYLEEYTATLSTGVRDEAGNALASAYAWTFSTAAAPDTAAPAVSSVLPPDGSVVCAGTSTSASVTFSEEVDPATVNGQTFTLSSGTGPVAGSVSAESPTTFTFSPQSGLSYATSYTGTVTTGVRDLAGNALPASYSWTFATPQAGFGTWQPTPNTILPPVAWHSAVWTGAEMIAWGGYTQTMGQNVYVGLGHRYDPVANSWSETSGAGAPSPRYGHLVAWTGSEMIVWGGVSFGLPAISGARYRADTDSWTTMSTAGAPPEHRGTAVWTGTEMLVWSGGVGGGYRPSTDSWRPLPLPGIARAVGHTAVWTGGKMIVWGGHPALAAGIGAAYDPLTDTWETTSTVNAPSGRQYHAAVWSGTEMIVWGGRRGGSAVSNGGAYNPATDTWRAISGCGTSPMASHTAVWSGSEMIVFGGDTGGNATLAYGPATDSWRQISFVNAPEERDAHSAVWTGSEMIVWGGRRGALELRSGARLRP